MICFTFKGVKLNEKEFKVLSVYLSKISKYPVHVAQIKNSQLLLISKDSIIKQFIAKPKFEEYMKINEETKTGIFLLSFNRQEKMDVINNVCKR